jgi:nitroreductase
MAEGVSFRPVDVVDGIRRRRMHRVFTDDPVPREVLDRLVWAASRAQQARSGVRHLVVVDDPRLMATARQVLPGFINNAPAMLVHCSDLAAAARLAGPACVEVISRLDAGAACAHLALIAQTLGLGTCTVTSWTETTVRALLDLPEHVRPDVTVAVGYVTASAPRAPKGFVTAAHHNRFGTEWGQA